MSGKGKVLTPELIFSKVKSDNLQSIKNLNLWGNELQDLQLIERMPSLEVISLSVNRIATLRDFSKCLKLQQLYLRKNCIEDLKEIRYLLKLPTLKVLWLHDNPCANVPNYREIVIHHLPNLVKLDNNLITQEERVDSQKMQFDILMNMPENDRNEQINQSNHSNQQKSYMKASEQKRNRPYSQMPKEYREQKPQSEVNPWKGGSNKQVKQSSYESISEQNLNRNKNILIAVMSLVKELDIGSLELVHKQVEKLMNNKYR